MEIKKSRPADSFVVRGGFLAWIHACDPWSDHVVSHEKNHKVIHWVRKGNFSKTVNVLKVFYQSLREVCLTPATFFKQHFGGLRLAF